METYLNDPMIKKIVVVMLVVVTALFAALTINTLKEYGTIGQSVELNRTISVDGEGEVIAVPDIALVTMSVEAEGLDIPKAQEEAAREANALIDYLKESDVDEKDIKTTNYSISPQYDYVREICPVGAFCPGGRQELRGYKVMQTLQVKVRDTERVGEIVSGLGERGATNLYGPNFQVDDTDTLYEEAREKAIQDAKAEAERLADALGVRLVKVVSFYDNSNRGFYPAYGLGNDAALERQESKIVPEIPKGENVISAQVTVTYEIR